MSYKIMVIIEQDEAGYYAYAPELPGCQSQGDSLDDIMANIQEAIELYLETLTLVEKQQLLNKTVFTRILEVALA
jgi:predicted RNase H-like HicB family nuclease